VATTLTSEPLDFFKPDPGNPRQSCTEDELRALGELLKKKQVVPVLAKPDGTIIDGWHRWQAAKLLLVEIEGKIQDGQTGAPTGEKG
jgi:ParB family transcriptional regulator, chromosome partitioning protein